MRRAPEIIIVAGPNGAGKTSFAGKFLSPHQKRFVFVNADEIARQLRRPGLSERRLDIAAARRMIEQIRELTASQQSLVLETTLSTRGYARLIPAWRQVGYKVGLIYLRLPSVEASIARVANRVAHGGHNILDADIRRRFRRSSANLEAIYKGLVDEWSIWKSLEGKFEIEARWDDK